MCRLCTVITVFWDKKPTLILRKEDYSISSSKCLHKNNHQQFVAEACYKDLSTSLVLHHHSTVIFHLHGVFGVSLRLLIMLSAANNCLTGCCLVLAADAVKIFKFLCNYLQAKASVKAFISHSGTQSAHYVIVSVFQFQGHKFDLNLFSPLEGNCIAHVITNTCQL